MAVTLSQIRAWSTEHLTNAAGYWTQTADRWEDAFLTMRNQSHAITWHGAGGDALRQRSGVDLSFVSGKADQLRQAAQVARAGASDISAAKRSALYAVEDAQNTGFDVGEDLSVSYDETGGTVADEAARQAQAVELAAQIWSRAAQLEGTDQKVAGQLTGAASGYAPGVSTTAPAHNGVQLVDFKQDGPQPAPGQPIPPQPPSIKIPQHPNPPAVINMHVGENPTPDPGKHQCNGWDITKGVGEGVGGPLLTTGSVIGGIAAAPLGPAEWAMAIGGFLTGLSTTIQGFEDLSGCQ